MFDTAPSGHTTRLVSLPETMSAWTQGMLDRHSRAQRFTDAIRNLDEEDPAFRTISGEEGSRSARDAEIRHVLLARQERFSRLRDLLRNSEQTAFVAVLLGERLPALETVELAAQLRESGMAVAALVVNRRSPPTPANCSPSAVPRRLSTSATSPTGFRICRWPRCRCLGRTSRPRRGCERSRPRWGDCASAALCPA